MNAKRAYLAYKINGDFFNKEKQIIYYHFVLKRVQTTDTECSYISNFTTQPVWNNLKPI
jgi:hypothetical protein